MYCFVTLFLSKNRPILSIILFDRDYYYDWIVSNNNTEKNRKLNVKNKGKNFGSRHDNDIKIALLYSLSVLKIVLRILQIFNMNIAVKVETCMILLEKMRKHNTADNLKTFVTLSKSHVSELHYLYTC